MIQRYEHFRTKMLKNQDSGRWVKYVDHQSALSDKSLANAVFLDKAVDRVTSELRAFAARLGDAGMIGEANAATYAASEVKRFLGVKK